MREDGERGRGTGSPPGSPPVVVPGEKDDEPGPIRRWWADPVHRQVAVVVLGVVLFAGAVWLVGQRVGTSPPPPGSPSTGTRSQPPAVQQYRALQDSLEAGVDRYQDLRASFETEGVDCPELAAVYRRVDSLFVEMASRYQAVRTRLSPDQRTRHRALFDRMTGVNQSYDESNCPRPE